MSQTGKTWVTLNLWSLFKYLGLNDKIRNVDKSSGLGNGQMSMRLVCLNSQHYVYNKCSLNISPDFLLTLVRIQNKVSEMNEVTQSKTKNRIRFWGIKNMDDKHTVLAVSFSLPLIQQGKKEAGRMNECQMWRKSLGFQFPIINED